MPPRNTNSIASAPYSYATTTGSAWSAVDWDGDITTPRTNLTMADLQPTYVTHTPSIVTTDMMEMYINRIYKLILEHTKLDISEEEFMDVVMGRKLCSDD